MGGTAVIQIAPYLPPPPSCASIWQRCELGFCVSWRPDPPLPSSHGLKYKMLLQIYCNTSGKHIITVTSMHFEHLSGIKKYAGVECCDAPQGRRFFAVQSK